MATKGTITALKMDNHFGSDGPNKIEIDWTSDTGGDIGLVQADICAEFAAVNAGAGLYLSPGEPVPVRLKGRISRVSTNPGGTAPTVNYDIQLKDEDGIDVMKGALTNRHNANSEMVIPDVAPYIDSELSLDIVNAGDSKTGSITIYMEE